MRQQDVVARDGGEFIKPSCVRVVIRHLSMAGFFRARMSCAPGSICCDVARGNAADYNPVTLDPSVVQHSDPCAFYLLYFSRDYGLLMIPQAQERRCDLRTSFQERRDIDLIYQRVGRIENVSSDENKIRSVAAEGLDNILIRFIVEISQETQLRWHTRYSIHRLDHASHLPRIRIFLLPYHTKMYITTRPNKIKIATLTIYAHVTFFSFLAGCRCLTQ